jgi:hypothetical protein
MSWVRIETEVDRWWYVRERTSLGGQANCQGSRGQEATASTIGQDSTAAGCKVRVSFATILVSPSSSLHLVPRAESLWIYSMSQGRFQLGVNNEVSMACSGSKSGHVPRRAQSNSKTEQAVLSYHSIPTTSGPLEDPQLEPPHTLLSEKSPVSASSLLSLTSRTDPVSFEPASHDHLQYELNYEAMVGFEVPSLDSSQDRNHFLREPIFKNSSTPGNIENCDLFSFWSSPNDPIASSSDGNEEAELIMHYLDQVFYIQFPFYGLSTTASGRGWLLSLLGKVKPLYSAVLALSQFHRNSLRQVTTNNATVDAHKFYRMQVRYNMALKELQIIIGESLTWSGTTGLIRSIQALTCILQLLFFEVCHLQFYSIFKADLRIKSYSVALLEIGVCTFVRQPLWCLYL